jgi:hypothetical protein
MPIIRSSINCTHSICGRQTVCVQPSSWMILTHPRLRLDTHCLSTPDAESTVNWAPDDGPGICPKHVERLKGNNKVLYSVILLEFFEINPYFFMFLGVILTSLLSYFFFFTSLYSYILSFSSTFQNLLFSIVPPRFLYSLYTQSAYVRVALWFTT